MEFRDALNATMERYNIIAERLAEKAGITPYTISVYRNAKQGTTVGVLEKILDALTEEQRRFLWSQAYSISIEHQEIEALLSRMDDLDTKLLLRVLDEVTRALIRRQKAESSSFLSAPMLPGDSEVEAVQPQPDLKKVQNPTEPAPTKVATRVKKTGKPMRSIDVPETAFSRTGEILIEWVDLSRAIKNEEWVVQRLEDQTLQLLKAEVPLIRIDRQPPKLSLLVEANDFIISLRQLLWEVSQDPSRHISKPAKKWLILLDWATGTLQPNDATVFLRSLFEV